MGLTEAPWHRFPLSGTSTGLHTPASSWAAPRKMLLKKRQLFLKPEGQILLPVTPVISRLSTRLGRHSSDLGIFRASSRVTRHPAGRKHRGAGGGPRLQTVRPSLL